MVTVPSRSRTRISGEAPTAAKPAKSKKNRKGAGLIRRSARYSAKGGSAKGTEKRCDGTTWKQSPARMYSLARSTAAMKPASVKLLSGAGGGGKDTGPAGRGRGRSSAASASSRRACAASHAARGSCAGRRAKPACKASSASRTWSKAATMLGRTSTASGMPSTSGLSAGSRSISRTMS